MAKRSIAIAGHRTSISLEEPFWTALAEIAALRSLSLSGLVAEIDRDRPARTNLSSAVRMFVLAWFKEPARAEPVRPGRPPAG